MSETVEGRESADSEPVTAGSAGAPRTLILNAYSAGNLGDGAIVALMCRELAARGAAVSVMSDDPRDGLRYGVPVVPPFLEVWSPRARGLLGAASEAGWLVRQQLATRPHPVFLANDLVLSAGGGYLYDDGTTGSRRNLLRRLHALSLALRSGRPVVAFSQSIGPFASRGLASLTGYVLRRCSRVLVRDRISVAECARLGVSCSLVDDVVFTARPLVDAAVDAILAESVGDGPAPVAATVVDWSFPRARNRPYRSQRYVEALAHALAEAGRRSGRPICVVRQVAVHGRDTDESLSRRLVELVGRSWAATRVDLHGLDVAQIVGFYSRMHLVLASRLHSAIFACCGGTPAVVVGYLPKCVGVMERVGFERYVVPIDRVTPATLVPLVLEALGRRDDLAAQLARRVPELRASALAGFDLALAAS